MILSHNHQLFLQVELNSNCFEEIKIINIKVIRDFWYVAQARTTKLVKINNKFFVHAFQNNINKNDILAATILNLTNKHKAKINENFSILVNNGPGSFSTIRVALSIAKGIKISNNIKLYGFKNSDLAQFNLENIEVLINKNLLEKNIDKTIIFKLN